MRRALCITVLSTNKLRLFNECIGLLISKTSDTNIDNRRLIIPHQQQDGVWELGKVSCCREHTSFEKSETFDFESLYQQRYSSSLLHCTCGTCVKMNPSFLRLRNKNRSRVFWFFDSTTARNLHYFRSTAET
jgi:hypothetical protein